MPGLTIALAQTNMTVGALATNADKVIEFAQRAADSGADLVVFPELALSGYPPEDLLLKRHFIEDCEKQLDRLAEELPPQTVVLVGSPEKGPRKAYNAAVVFSGGRRQGSYHKVLLPNYGVFDEKRVMAAGTQPLVLHMGNFRIGVHICEDSWFVDRKPCRDLRGHSLDAVVNLSSSPYHRAKHEQRLDILGNLADALNTHLLYCNLVGGQDELVFDGGSKVVSPQGDVLARAQQYEEDLLLFSLPAPAIHDEAAPPASTQVSTLILEHASQGRPVTEPIVHPLLDDLGEVYGALKLGLGDYVRKNGFEQVVVAISGGIDSALVAALAVDALGPDRVMGLTMPSQYSSSGTIDDAGMLSHNLGIDLKTVPIHELFAAYEHRLKPFWPGWPADVTEENLQARIRGNIVMAFSNKFGWLVLTTGNKSEMATGYCTLYGDMVGGFAVIKDVPKTLVFELCEWRNAQAGHPVIPPTTISRPPSAELRPDQRDDDSLPPYDVLDPILEQYVEEDRSAAQIVKNGFDPETVLRVIRLVDSNEYKRRQGAPGIKITPKAFGRDRRLPITNRYRESI